MQDLWGQSVLGMLEGPWRVQYSWNTVMSAWEVGDELRKGWGGQSQVVWGFAGNCKEFGRQTWSDLVFYQDPSGCCIENRLQGKEWNGRRENNKAPAIDHVANAGVWKQAEEWEGSRNSPGGKWWWWSQQVFTYSSHAQNMFYYYFLTWIIFKVCWICYNTVYVLFFFGCKACGILTPWPGMESASPALEGKALTVREVPQDI